MASSSRLQIFLLVCVVILHLTYVSPDDTNYPFRNTSLSWDARVDDLVQRLTLDEIGLQMAYGGPDNSAPAIPRLNIKPYGWGTECLRGDAEAGLATSFPQAIGLSATFSTDVLFNVSRATGLEVRSKYNNYTKHGEFTGHKGLSCWSPVINILRDPRWGRNQETYGEDPFMTGELAASFVHGLQGSHPRFLLTNACCKHFAAYAGPEDIPQSRYTFDAKVSEHDLRMTFLPQFKRCVDAGAKSVMCSYNRINGVPACANKMLLSDILRDEWGFDGYVISDEGAIEFMLTDIKYLPKPSDIVAASVKSGTNLEDNMKELLVSFFALIPETVKDGKLTEAEVREAVKPLMHTRMLLGEFDPPATNPYTKLNPDDYVQSAAHRELSILTAMRSYVLLKNKEVLPFPPTKRFNKIAVVGPMADDLIALYGDYAPTPDARYAKTPRQALTEVAHNVTYAPGCVLSLTPCLDYDSNSVRQAIHDTEMVFVCLGTGVAVEMEGNDRPNMELPGKQDTLLRDAIAAANGKPVVLLLFSAGALDISWAHHSDKVHAIIQCWFPAQATGDALLRVMFNNGTAANPAGRLPYTWPHNITQVPAMTNYSMAGRTYRYADYTPLYPFGYGLSYSRFTYTTLNVSPLILRPNEDIDIDVSVKNMGPYDGEEVVQVYVKWGNITLQAPRLQLVAFKRVEIKMGAELNVRLHVKREQLGVWQHGIGYVVQPGKMMLFAGGQQPNQQTVTPSNVLFKQFIVV